MVHLMLKSIGLKLEYFGFDCLYLFSVIQGKDEKVDNANHTPLELGQGGPWEDKGVRKIKNSSK